MRLIMVAFCVAPLLTAFQAGGGGGGGPVSTRPDGVTTPPVVLLKVQPTYPSEAEAAKLEGDVWVSTLIDTKGIPTDIKVTRSLGLGLDERAIAAVAQWRFKPGMKDGVPVSVRATIAVSFHVK
jgi:TonB family protein